MGLDAGHGSDERGLSGDDQSSADADQAGADVDQTASDVDQSASERDQRSSDRDQAAADIDQARSDRTRGSSASWAGTRRTRARNTKARDVASHARLASVHARDHVAELRDRAAEARDAAANTRDKLAATLDAETAAIEHADATTADGQSDPLAENLGHRRAAATARDRAAAARAEAARDRKAARADRRRAAIDRERASVELALEGADHLTGAMRRGAGMRALTRELARARRTQQSVLVAFVDVDGLKAVNDEHGHAAGDDLLRAVVTSLEGMLRPYDVVMRYGGDEFVCILCDQGSVEISGRFERAIANFERVHHTRISVGLAVAIADETPEDLVARADAAMIASRGQRQGDRR